jgi:hypothetical protein
MNIQNCGYIKRISKMKKLLYTALLINYVLIADGSHMQFYVGSTTVEDGDSQTSFGLGYDFVKSFTNGIESGLGADFLYFVDDEYYDSGYNANLSLILGYSFNSTFDIPVALRGGFGYGFGILGDSMTTTGLIYTAAIEYDITKKVGIGIKYYQQDFTAEGADNSVDADAQSILGYIYYSFR